MEANKKLRGQRHHYNKVRYQNKAKVISKVATEKGSPNKDTSKERFDTGLKNNWHRYKELSDDDETDESTNFSLLAQAPISHGGHFQFKSDKNVESEFDFETLRKNKMFSLDLHLLECSLSTIPYHERCGLDESYLTESQLEEINKRTQQNKVQYESYLKISSITKEFSNQSISNSGGSDSKQQNSSSLVAVDAESDTEISPVVETKESPKENVNINKEVQTPTTTKKTKNISKVPDLEEDKEELEQWLDDILSN